MSSNLPADEQNESPLNHIFPEGPEQRDFSAIAKELGLGDCALTKAGATRVEAEHVMENGRRVFGALPQFDHMEEHLEGLRDDFRYFQEKLAIDPSSLTASQRQSMLTYRLKFDTSITGLMDNILRYYPVREGKTGKSIALYGLSGSGKSLAAAAFREHDPEAVIMDADTARLNLFGRIIRDVEMPNSGSLEEVRNHLIHNPAVSGMIYLVLETVAKQLKERGYTVIQSANVPASGTDEVYYLEHPDPMVDPFNMKTSVPSVMS